MKVGVKLSTLEVTGPGHKVTYAGTRDLALLAEQAGFDSVWLADHLLFRRDGSTEGVWECWTFLSALAEATRRVELGALVLCAPFRNPGLIAKMAATLDEVSDGRLILGLGAGGARDEFEAFDFPFDHRVDRFDEALQVVTALLRHGRVDFSGRYYRLLHCDLRPRGPRPTGPPVLVGGSGPRMLRLTARYADLWNINPVSYPTSLDKPRRALHAACTDVGRDPATLGVTTMTWVVFPDLDAGDPSWPEHLSEVRDVVSALQGLERRGVEQVIVQLVPSTPPALARLADALTSYRSLPRPSDSGA